MEHDAMFEDAMEANPVDFEAFVKKVNEADALANEIAGLEATLGELSARQKTILVDELPDLMARANINDYTTGSGRQLERKEILNGTWPKDEPTIERAVSWLEDNNLADLLKATIVMAFNREDRATAQERFETLRGDNVAKSVTYKEEVHYQTLGAMLRERKDNDLPIPEEIFNVYQQVVVSLTTPKPKAKSKAKSR